ncbi:putative transcriptional regulator with C-terminal CBS domains [Halalkaliarchaeum sp. AArc-CO]|uniref:CBS domain-containing protein n=1 Tax=unclassified Halalkaliarchaeum TaxID=2678344 RepID=UPI00217E042C|nr:MULTISPECIES: CBS domain-containing protein [unclassified Halalkaliarchaeum]MDR5673177.1 CBS domain-containing protein [Halalkaliarchaeum sp. AArc-GB]UWG51868.1 putative transcriptional regulator with C-terminal CBS domains [Halalkaliarchaeum sp. AArc-CO]
MELPTPQDLRERRTELELTQSELADAAGVSQPLIARIEGGDVDPRLSTLRRIVAALDEAEGEVVRAKDLMHESVVSVEPDDAVSEAVDLMEREAYSQLPVLQNGVPVGSISQSDVIHAGGNVGNEPVSEIMSESFPTVSQDVTVDEIRNLLDHYKAVVVTEGGEAVGIITEADIAAHLS